MNIYNLKGEKVETLVNGFHSLGNYYIDWNASGVASGIYLVQLKGTDNFKLNLILITSMIVILIYVLEMVSMKIHYNKLNYTFFLFFIFFL